MTITNDVHHQFAGLFGEERLLPYAWLVSKKLAEGHICVPLESFDAALQEAPFELKSRSHETTLRALPLVARQGERQPFVLHGGRLYLHRYFAYETAILDRLRHFLQQERSLEAGRVQELAALAPVIRQLFPPQARKGEPTDWQLVAALLGFRNQFTIITGGPGTGKTTTVARILALLFTAQPGLRVALAAPTGKAAARMHESLLRAELPKELQLTDQLKALEPRTLHRLLGFIPDTTRFRHDAKNPIDADVVIIDESSMIDAALFAKLLTAIGPQTRLILLGDRHQLASVEAGSLFGDLCQAQTELNRLRPETRAWVNAFTDASNGVPEDLAAASDHPLFEHVIELRYSHRFAGEAGIGRFSRAIIGQQAEGVQAFFAPATDPEITIDPEAGEKTFEAFVDGFSEYIRETDIAEALKKLNRLRVLCALREGQGGVYPTNRRIEDYLHRKGLINRGAEHYEHRPVMITRNSYALGLFNGDTGILRSDEKGVLRAWFDDGAGGLRSVLPAYLGACETVYAMTIHKSQGSEFDKVLIALPPNENALLTSELLYTAVTRARKAVLLQGPETVILHAVAQRVQRGSGLIDRIQTIR